MTTKTRALVPEADCQSCARLANHLAAVRVAYPAYHARPVLSFGVIPARLLVVGLAPGLHGANASGRPFTGDHAGILLYQTLFDFNFASHPQSVSCTDGLLLRDCRITNAVRCLPPQNRPTPEEVRTCNGFLQQELAQRQRLGVVLALGGIAHGAVVRALGLRLAAFPFSHGAEYALPNGGTLISSYHCSRYNTQTKRLTTPMFYDVFARIRARLTAGL